jgi:hypothetical protein
VASVLSTIQELDVGVLGDVYFVAEHLARGHGCQCQGGVLGRVFHDKLAFCLFGL